MAEASVWITYWLMWIITFGHITVKYADAGVNFIDAAFGALFWPLYWSSQFWMWIGV